MESILDHLPPAEILGILRRRLAKARDSSAITQSLLALDEGLDLIDKKESEEIKKMQKQMRDKADEHDGFRGSFRENHKGVKEDAKKRRLSGKTPAGKRLPDGDISQKSAKTYLPPLSSIWRDRIRGGWCGHRQGVRRCRFTWASCGGEREALIECLRHLWSDHLELACQDESMCTVVGLFDKPPAAGAAVCMPGAPGSSGLAGPRP